MSETFIPLFGAPPLTFAGGIGGTPGGNPGEIGMVDVSDDPARVDPLVVTLTPEGGQEYLADFLSIDLDVSRPINDLSTARLGVRLDAGWLISLGVPDLPIYTPIDQLITDETLITIRTARPDPSTDVILFLGFMTSIERSAAQGAKRAAISAIDAATRLFDGANTVVRGQVMHRAANWYSLAATPMLNKALPAVYNPDGKGNRRDIFVSFTEDSPGEGQPASFDVPLATTPGADPGARAYNYAAVFLDLFYRARMRPDGTLGPWPFGLREANLWTLIHFNEWHQLDPDHMGSFAPSDAWARALTSKPVDLGLEGLTWGDALKLVCNRCGVGFVVEPEADPQSGEAKQVLRFFCPGATDARRITLKLPSRSYRTDNKEWADIRAAADVVQMAVKSRYDAGFNRAFCEGGPVECEVTLELVPGWLYSAGRDPQVDVDPGNASQVSAALAKIGSEAWLDQYTGRGRLHSQHWDVLRRWIVADAAPLTAQGYGRPSGVYGESRYALFDFATCRLGGIGEPGGLYASRQHAARARPLKPCVTRPATGQQPFPPIVEVSYDSGSTWRRVMGGAQVFKRRMGVYFEANDLADELDPESGKSFAEAYIRGQLRVRVTGVIESDSVPAAPETFSAYSLMNRRRDALLQRPKHFRVRIREDQTPYVAGGNSQFRTGSLPREERFDAMDAEMANWVEGSDRLRHSGMIQMPGVIAPQLVGSELLGPRPGDELLAIEAESGQHTHDVSFASRLNTNYAIVAALRWAYCTGDGKGRGLTARTELTLEDADQAVRLAVAGG